MEPPLGAFIICQAKQPPKVEIPKSSKLFNKSCVSAGWTEVVSSFIKRSCGKQQAFGSLAMNFY